MTGPAPKVIYLTGWGRSGSTLLNRLLIGDGVVGIGELRLLWQRGVVQRQDCSCGRPWDQCELWHPVVRSVLADRADSDDPVAAAAKLHALGTRAARAVARRPGHVAGPSAEYAAVLSDVYRAIADQSGASVIIDSSKHPAQALLARASDADVTIVHLVRDPRAVVWSHQRAKAPPPGATANTTEQHGPTYVAARWAVRNSFIERRVEPDLRVRYEDMVAETNNTTKAIFAAAGVDVPGEGDGVEHLIAGNPNRFDTARPTVLSEDLEWREALPASHRRITELITGRGMRKYDYA